MHVFASSQLPPLQYLTQPLSPSSLPTFYISFLLSSFILWFNLLFWSSSLFLSVCCHFILHSSFSHSLEWKCIKKKPQMLQILTNIQCHSLQFFYCPSAFLPSFFHSCLASRALSHTLSSIAVCESLYLSAKTLLWVLLCIFLAGRQKANSTTDSP